ncbi:MAG: hypothetical protein JWM48_1839 [Mycobacterium sp.]|nr:hypothetical protein [Mycobacterium sp.]
MDTAFRLRTFGVDKVEVSAQVEAAPALGSAHAASVNTLRISWDEHQVFAYYTPRSGRLTVTWIPGRFEAGLECAPVAPRAVQDQWAAITEDWLQGYHGGADWKVRKLHLARDFAVGDPTGWLRAHAFHKARYSRWASAFGDNGDPQTLYTGTKARVVTLYNKASQAPSSERARTYNLRFEARASATEVERWGTSQTSALTNEACWDIGARMWEYSKWNTPKLIDSLTDEHASRLDYTSGRPAIVGAVLAD